MKPTQEQIEAALAYAEERDTLDHCNTLHKCRPERILSENSLAILAAAYRELLEENKQLKAWADLAISSNALYESEKIKNQMMRAQIRATITENLHLADGDDCTLKRLKDAIKFEPREEP